MKVVVCLTTYNRVDCARISVEIVKGNWPISWPVVHACSSPDYEATQEDLLMPRPRLPLTTGALDLLQSSVRGAVEAFEADYVIHLEGDTWIFDQQVISRYIERLENDKHAVIAASSWSTDRSLEWRESAKLGRRLRYRLASAVRPLGLSYGIRETKSLSTQFFIAKATPDFVAMMANMQAKEHDCLEKVLYRDVVQHFGKRGILPMMEREPVQPAYRNSCEALSLVCHHWPSKHEAPSVEQSPDLAPIDRLIGKREALAQANLANVGTHMARLLQAECVQYYNGDAKRR